MGFIKSIAINEFNGAFFEVINFNPGLNILSGVNGTGKTTVLKRIKENFGSNIVQKEGTVSKVLSFSPKRNAEKKTVQAILQQIRQHSKTMESVLNEASGRQIVDNTFEKYESLGDLYIYDFQDRCKNGGDQIQEMVQLTTKYNEIVKSVFPEYEIQTEWNTDSGSPDIKLLTKYGVPIDLSLMSCGESEVLALIFNIYFNKNSVDVFLIDEPEVHLNWTLEKGLFRFFDKFASEYNKQIIVTSHSRVIFDHEFRDKTQFLVFRNKKVFSDPNPPSEVLEEIAGEMVAIISTAAPTQKTFFVEDEFHKALVSSLLNINEKTAEIVIVKDASGMIGNLYKILKSNPQMNSNWANAYLMVDGDGKDEQYKEESKFIHLKRFVAESYCFDIDVMANALGLDMSELKTIIISLIKADGKYFEGKHKHFISKVLNKITEDDIDIEFMSSFDCSSLYKKLMKDQNKQWEDYLNSYLGLLKTENKLELIFDEKLLNAVNI